MFLNYDKSTYFYDFNNMHKERGGDIYLFISSLFYFVNNYTIVIEIIILFTMSTWYQNQN